jgi:hypothetical protein
VSHHSGKPLLNDSKKLFHFYRSSVKLNPAVHRELLFKLEEIQDWSARATGSGLSSWVRSNLARQLPI